MNSLSGAVLILMNIWSPTTPTLTHLGPWRRSILPSVHISSHFQCLKLLFAIEHEEGILDHAPWIDRPQDRVLVERAAGVEIELYQGRRRLVPDVDGNVRGFYDGDAREPAIADRVDIGDVRAGEQMFMPWPSMKFAILSLRKDRPFHSPAEASRLQNVR